MIKTSYITYNVISEVLCCRYRIYIKNNEQRSRLIEEGKSKANSPFKLSFS